MKRLFFLLTLLSLVGCYHAVPEKTGLEGKPLPEFSLLLTDSSTYFNTRGIPSGNPVVLFYFSPQCPYCRAQMGEIIENIHSLKNIRFYIFTDWSFPDMKAFYVHYQLNSYPNIIMGVDYANFFEGYFKVRGVPYIAIYGKNKLLKEAFNGKVDISQIKDAAED